jgi:hypothetical protein
VNFDTLRQQGHTHDSADRKKERDRIGHEIGERIPGALFHSLERQQKRKAAHAHARQKPSDLSLPGVHHLCFSSSAMANAPGHVDGLRGSSEESPMQIPHCSDYDPEPPDGPGARLCNQFQLGVIAEPGNGLVR